MSTEDIAAQSPATENPVSVGENENPEFYDRCCADMRPLPTAAPGNRLDGMKAILTRANLLWENGRVLTVGFVGPWSGTVTQQNKVKTVVREWEKYANLKFMFIPNGADAIIRIAFQPRAGSWSYMGKDALHPSIPRGAATMNFGWVYGTPGITLNEQGVILHEFGHAIGYLHEHQSPRRGEKLRLNEQVIIDYYARTQVPPWDEAKTRANVLNTYTTQEVTNFSACDFTSIMMYYMPAEFNVQGITINPNNTLSPLDKAFAFLNYPFLPGFVSSDPSVNLVNALNTVGITGAFRASMAAEYAEGDWRGLRAEFTRWSVNQRALADKSVAVGERELTAAAVFAPVPALIEVN